MKSGERVKDSSCSTRPGRNCAGISTAAEFDQSPLFRQGLQRRISACPAECPTGCLLVRLCRPAPAPRRHRGQGSMTSRISRLVAGCRRGLRALRQRRRARNCSASRTSQSFSYRQTFRASFTAHANISASAGCSSVEEEPLRRRRPAAHPASGRLEGQHGTRMDGFRYREGRSGQGIDDWLWGNGVYAFGAVCDPGLSRLRLVCRYLRHPCDTDDAGLITGLPAPHFSTREASSFAGHSKSNWPTRSKRPSRNSGSSPSAPAI